jgi:hypothetical protein
MKKITLLLLFTIGLTGGSAAQSPRMDLITGFYQDEVLQDPQIATCLNDYTWGNCVTIAAIKVAIATFGSVKQIYTAYVWQGDTLHITFRDGLQITLSRADTAQARNAFGVLQGNAGWMHRDSAIIVYASICMRAFVRKDQYPQGSCMHSFHDALGFINAGYTTGNAGELLGIKLIRIRLRDLKGSRAAIVRSSAHAAFCTYGAQDIEGDPYKIGGLYWMKNPRGWGSVIMEAYTIQN